MSLEIRSVVIQQLTAYAERFDVDPGVLTRIYVAEPVDLVHVRIPDDENHSKAVIDVQSFGSRSTGPLILSSMQTLAVTRGTCVTIVTPSRTTFEYFGSSLPSDNQNSDSSI